MFEGFSEETLGFFSALRMNNNREFFEQMRPVYENAVRGPLVELANALAPTVAAIDPELDIRPARTVSRINRDLRFRKEKIPYRDYMWLGFRRIGEGRMESCGFYFDISAESANWGCGFYHMQPETMANLRAKLKKEPDRVKKILANKAFKAHYDVKGDAYVKQHQPPEGMPEQLGALYRKKSVYAEHTVTDMHQLFSPALVEEIAEGYRILEPFYNLIRECMVKG